MKKLLLILLFGSAICFGQTNTSLAKNPKIDLEVLYENNNIVYKIETNIPLPVEVMIGIEPKGIADDDPAYGFSKRIKINESPYILSVKAEDT